MILIKKPFSLRSNPITTIFGTGHSGDLTALCPDAGIELSDHPNVDYRISFLPPYLESYGFLFKILIKMAPYQLMGLFQSGYCLAEKTGWYERIENNGWRLVSDRLITNLLTDPVTWETSRKKVDFSHVTVLSLLIFVRNIGLN